MPGDRQLEEDGIEEYVLKRTIGGDGKRSFPDFSRAALTGGLGEGSF